MVALLSSSVFGLEVRSPHLFVCKQGNCIDGTGTVLDIARSLLITGEWASAATIPGKSYTITPLIAPTRQFQQVFGKDGRLESGDQPRLLGLGSSTAIPYFTGRYGTIDDPFSESRVTVISEGTYFTGFGIHFEGQFKYIPTKNGGFFLFFGERVDQEEDERETGLFVSDETFDQAPARFVKADPSYLALLQEKYQRDLAFVRGERLKAQEEFARKAESEKRWQAVFSIVARIGLGAVSAAVNVSGNGVGLGALSGLGGSAGAGLGGQIALSLVSTMLAAPNNSGSAEEITRGLVGSAVADEGLAGALVTSLLTSATAAATVPDSGVSGEKAASIGNPVVNTLGAAVITRTGGLISSAIEGADLGTTGVVLGAITRETTAVIAEKAATASADGVIGGDQKPSQRQGVSRESPIKTNGDSVANHDSNSLETAVAARRERVTTGDGAGFTPASGVPEPQSTPALIPSEAIEVDIPRPDPQLIDNGVPLGMWARLASVRSIDPPEGMDFASGTLYATNDGVYLPLVRRRDRQKHVGKYMDHSEWGVRSLGEFSTGFSPVTLNSETSNSSYFYFTYFDSRRRIQRYERGGLNVQLISPGPWMDIDSEGLVFVPNPGFDAGRFRYVVSGNAIWVDCNCGRYGPDGKPAYQFTAFHDKVLTSAEVGDAGFVAHMAVSNGDGGAVFVPLGDLRRLIRVRHDEYKIFDLGNFGPGIINTVIHYEGRIWIGLGAKILMIDADEVTEVHEIKGILPTYRPTFCIQASTLYMASGESGTVTELIAYGPKSFLHDTPYVRDQDLATLIEWKSALGTGIYCSENSSHYVYAMSVDFKTQSQRLIRIQPPAWRGPLRRSQ